MSNYDLLRRRHLEDSRRLVPGLVDRLSWSTERLREHRRQLLARLIARAQADSPWHSDRLAGIDPSTVDEPTFLARVAPMTKDDLMDNWDAVPTDRRLSLDLVESHLGSLRGDGYLLDRFHGAASGGSTGRRGVFVYDWDEWTICYFSWVRHLIRARKDDPALGRSPLVIGSVAAAHATHLSSSFFQWASNPDVQVTRFPVSLPVPEIVAGLNALQPTVLQGYPSALYGLTHEAAAGRLRIAPRRVFTSSEPLLPEIRSALESTWGVPVWNSWGASEGGGLGTPCEAGPWTHVADDLFLIEPVDVDGNPVPAGERSAKVYLTNLYNTTQPLIRYEITDEITVIPGECPCGSAHRRIADIAGRLDDVFRWGPVTVHPHVIRTVLGRERNVVEYQVRQRPNGVEVDLRTAGPVDLDVLAARIRLDLAALGLDSPAVAVRSVDRLDRQGTGKLRRFVPFVPGTHAGTIGS